MVHQKPREGQSQVARPVRKGTVTITLSKTSLIIYIMLVMVFIGFMSFVPLGEAQEHFIEPVVGVFLMIILMLIMLAAWVTKD